MARKQLAAYLTTKAEKRPQRKSTQRVTEREFDRMATDLPKGVMPAVVSVPCPSADGSVLRVIRNLRGDTLAYMRDRKFIDEHQYQAGRHWQRLYEDAEIGGVKAMDTTKEPVDGGGKVSDGLTDRVLKAVKGMARADAAVGLHGVRLIREVLGSGLTIGQIAHERGISTKAGKEKLGRQFRRHLDELAVAFGFASKGLVEKMESALEYA